MDQKHISIRIAALPDLDQVRQLFFDAITTVNASYYTPEQIAVWSSGYKNVERWEAKLREHYFLVAVIDHKVVGFTSLRGDGYLDYMFTHRDHQEQGIATMLLTALETEARTIQLPEIFVDVSITGRPFFRRHGYTIREMNTKIIKDIVFSNAVMQKVLQR